MKPKILIITEPIRFSSLGMIRIGYFQVNILLSDLSLKGWLYAIFLATSIILKF